ncbi:MAG: hypothetical protein HZA01_15580 [Nitrospinae bacterium]|nr:hypothetical protein [Nitrospinota bacterium]
MLPNSSIVASTLGIGDVGQLVRNGYARNLVSNHPQILVAMQERHQDITTPFSVMVPGEGGQGRSRVSWPQAALSKGEGERL